jgi:hypothetical protein
MSYKTLAAEIQALISNGEHVSMDLFRSFMESQMRQGITQIARNNRGMKNKNSSEKSTPSKALGENKEPKPKPASKKQQAKDQAKLGVYNKLLTSLGVNVGGVQVLFKSWPDFLDASNEMRGEIANKIKRTLNNTIAELELTKLPELEIIDRVNKNRKIGLNAESDASGDPTPEEIKTAVAQIRRKEAIKQLIIVNGFSHDESKLLQSLFPTNTVWKSQQARASSKTAAQGREVGGGEEKAAA